jgi:hypothetical protein
LFSRVTHHPPSPCLPPCAGWKPRRLGGGLGDTRRDRLPKKAEKAVGLGWVNAPIGGNYVVMSMDMKAAAAEADAAKRKAAAGGAGGGMRDGQ